MIWSERQRGEAKQGASSLTAFLGPQNPEALGTHFHCKSFQVLMFPKDCMCVHVSAGRVGDRVGRPAACPSEANKQARWVESKVCFLSDAGNLRGRVAGIYSKANSPPTPAPDRQGARELQGGATCRNSTVLSDIIFKLAISGLTSIILVVLGTVILQFQGHLFLFL